MPTGAAVLVRVPLALAEQLQASAVQHEVNRTGMRGHPRLATGDAAATLGERRVVRHSQIEPEQAQHAAAERLGLAQGEVEDEPQRQHQFDRKIGVSWPARRRPARCLPACKGCLSSQNVRSPRRRSPAS